MAKQKVESISDRIMQEKEFLNHAKANNGDGLTEDLEKHWVILYLTTLMHWIMETWKKNEDLFMISYGADREDYRNFLSAHQESLGIFNNSRVSEAIMFTQQLIDSDMLKADKYRTAEQKQRIRKLLDDRRKLFLYKYSLTHLHNFIAGMNGFLKADGISGIRDLDEAERKLQAGIHRKEQEAAGVIANFITESDEVKETLAPGDVSPTTSAVAPLAPKTAGWKPKKASLVDMVLRMYTK
jgi:hypothetical protein